AGAGEVPEAVLERLGEREGVVQRSRRAAEAETVVAAAEAPGGDLGDDLADLLAPACDHVDRPAQRVPPEEDRRAADDVDSLDVLEGDQIEVHLLHGRLVEADAVEEDAQPRRQAGDRRDRESPEREVRLKPVSLLTLQRDARKALERLRQHRGRITPDLRPGERVTRLGVDEGGSAPGTSDG